MKKKFSFLVLLSIIATLFIGCGSEDSKVKENKIVYSMAVEPEILDPTLNIYSRGSIVLLNLFKGLYKIDENNQVVPVMAESFNMDETGRKIVIKLKPNLKWSDGSPLTAHDFEYTWKRILNPETASRVAFDLYIFKNAQKYNKGEIKEQSEVGIKATDDLTLELELEAPTPYLKSLLTSGTFVPVKKSVVEGKEPWTKTANTFISTGPFMMKEIRSKEKLVLVKNPYYIDAANVKLDTLEIVFIGSPETELGAFLNNEIDVAENLNSDAKQRFAGKPELVESKRIGLGYWNFNTSRAPFNNANVRKAFALSIDREVIVKKIMQSPNEPAYAFIPSGIPYGEDQTKDYRKEVGNLVKEDKELARKLLAEGGYPNGKDFPKIVFITTTAQQEKDAAQAMQQMWKKELNIDVEIKSFESKAYWAEVHGGNFDLGPDGWGGGFYDPMTILGIFDSPNNVKNNRWSNKAYDELIQANRDTADQNIRMSNFAKAEKLLANEMPVMPMSFYAAQYLVSPKVKGVYKTSFGHTMFEKAEVKCSLPNNADNEKCGI